MPHNNLTTIASRMLSSTISRRKFIHRGATLGVASSAAGLLLSACGSPDSTPAGGAGAGTGMTQVPGTQTEVTTATPVPSVTPTAPPAATTAPIGTSVAAKHVGGTLVQAATADATTVNPILSSDTASNDVVALIFNAVMRIDPASTEPRGDLAKSWDISPDGLTYTFTLNAGVKWHDGQPLTSDDVKFTYEFHLNGDSGSPHTSEIAERIASIDAPDPAKVVFTLAAPASPFLVSNMIYGIVPRHILQDVAAADLAQHPFSTGKKDTTIGSGPFVFNEWVKDDHITLAKNPYYWKGTPNLDAFSFKVVPDPTALVQQLLTGEVDYSGRDGVDESSTKELNQESSITVVTYDSFDFTYYGYQLDETKSKLFQEKAVRQALLYALDRQQMVDAIRFGLGRVAVGTMGVDSWAHDPHNITLKYAYDPKQANQLLDDAGWVKGDDGVRAKDGVKLSFKLYTNTGNDTHAQYMAVMQQAWKAIGVDCTPTQEEWNAFLERITSTFDFDMFLIAFSWGVDPDQSSMWSTDAYGGGFNVNKYSNTQVDDLLQQGLNETAIPTRKQIYTKLQNIIVDDLPSAIIDFPKSIAAHNTRVHNLFPNAVDDRWNAHEWWIDG